MDISSLKLPGVKLSDSFSHVIGIQGEPNTGKTRALVSWPNVLALDFDKKLPKSVPCVEFWNDSVLREICGIKVEPNKPLPPVYRKDAIIKWLRAVGPSLPKDITLGVDSYTMIDNSWTEFVKACPQLFWNKDKEFNGREMFKQKFDFNLELFSLLKSTPCPVVITFHETVERNEKGGLTGKYRTLVNGGSFKDQLEGHLGGLFRTKNEKGKYYLQVRSNHLFDAMIPPGYKFPDNISEIEIPFEGSAYHELSKYKIS